MKLYFLYLWHPLNLSSYRFMCQEAFQLFGLFFGAIIMCLHEKTGLSETSNNMNQIEYMAPECRGRIFVLVRRWEMRRPGTDEQGNVVSLMESVRFIRGHNDDVDVRFCCSMQKQTPPGINETHPHTCIGPNMPGR